MMKKAFIATVALGLAAASGQAQVRVYQPPEAGTAPAAVGGVRVVYQTQAAQQKQGPAVEPPAVAAAAPKARPELDIYLPSGDFNRSSVQAALAVLAWPELRQMALTPQVFTDDLAPEAIFTALAEGVEALPENFEMQVDFQNEYAEALGLGIGQAMMIYRDSTGAVRLYNLRQESDRLRRQLARDLRAAQPER